MVAAFGWRGNAGVVPGAKRRLADEYDAAQERGEVASVRDGRRSSEAEDQKPTVADISLIHKDIHEARQIRDWVSERGHCRATPEMLGCR